jgi:hypothetical protein
MGLHAACCCLRTSTAVMTCCPRAQGSSITFHSGACWVAFRPECTFFLLLALLAARLADVEGPRATRRRRQPALGVKRSVLHVQLLCILTLAINTLADTYALSPGNTAAHGYNTQTNRKRPAHHPLPLKAPPHSCSCDPAAARQWQHQAATAG